MTVDLPDVHDRALQATGRVVAAIRPDQFEQESACEGMSVRELLAHVVSGNLWVGELMAGKTIEEVGDALDGDVLGDDPTIAYDESARVADDAFRSPDAMVKAVAVSYGPVPGEVYCGHRFFDVLIHGWDLAKGTGQDTAIDSELLDACREIMEPQLDGFRGAGALGAVIPVPDDATAQTRFLALLGRRA